MTEQSISIKVKIKLHDVKDANELQQLMVAFRDGCNYVSKYIFENDFVLNTTKIQKAIYYDLRSLYRLKSQVALTCIRSTVAQYKTVKTQLSQKPYRYDTGKKDKNGKAIWKSVPRDLTWLWYPINFKRPQANLQRNRDWSKLSDGDLSVAGLTKRIKVTPICHGFDQYFDGTWKLGAAKLLHVNDKWYLHIAATKDIPELQNDHINNVVGLDRGLRFITNGYDSKGKAIFFNGKQLVAKRSHYKKLRAKLQSKGTKSAKRRLKKIGNRENRWMTDVNHQVTKTLVNHYGPNTLFVIEDLTGIRKATEKVKKAKRYEQVSWAFYQFEQFLTYKANLYHDSVVKIDAHYTSQRCPKCGQIKKNNRDHGNHIYICSNCGYSSNDDRIGAMNIQQLGTQYVSGIENPKLVKLTNSQAC